MPNVTRYFAFALMLTAGTYLACGGSDDGGAKAPADAGSEEEEQEGLEDELPPPTPIVPSDASTDAPVTGGCFDEEGCTAGQVCRINGNEPAGVCEAMPTCTSGASGCACLMETPCPTGGRSACGVSADVAGQQAFARSCGQQVPAGLRAVGQTCSYYVACQDGLYCRVESVGSAGTCVANPAACPNGNTSAGDTCMATNITPCPTGQPSVEQTNIIGGGPTIELITVTCQ